MDNDQAPDLGSLRFLKTLVTVLTLTMIVGLVTIVGLFVTRFSAADDIGLPEAIVLPDGATATAFTQGDEWYAVVTDQNEILIYSRVTGDLRQRVTVEPE